MHEANLRTIPELRERGLKIVLLMKTTPMSDDTRHRYLDEMSDLWLETRRVRNPHKIASPPKQHTPLSLKLGAGKMALELRKTDPELSFDKMAERLGMREDGAAGRLSAFCKRHELLGGERPLRR
jgi:hypothetical protein